MKRMFLAALIASGLVLACDEQNESDQGGKPLTMNQPEMIDACAAVRCANGPCVVKDGRPVCTDATGVGVGGGDACKGVTCPNQGTCHVEAGKPFCTDACSAVECVNGPCVVVNGKATCMPAQAADAGAVDAAASGGCKADSDCATHVDYCAATCGVCVAVTKSARRPACSPPPNVFCINACENKKAVCEAGACVVR
jgi:hypothetical protein